MTVKWITPIYDRTYGDVLSEDANIELDTHKGCINYTDLNRIENNTQYVMEDMLERKIIRVSPSLAIKTNWTKNDIPTREHVYRIIENVKRLMEMSNPEVISSFDNIYDSTQWSYSLANSIEKNLLIMKNQPNLPIKKWYLSVVNGIIKEYNSSDAYVSEDETVTIEAVPYGEYAKYMEFISWTGLDYDLQYVGNTTSKSTTFKMVYHEDDNYKVVLTANFKTRIPRTLTLHDAIIYDGDLKGKSVGSFFAGDQILLLANIGGSGKRFYEWRGTSEALNNITGGTQPSTSYLVMPDCNVELTAIYINAGKHSVTIDNNIQGWYDYKENVSLIAKSPGDRYSFAYWSGDTGYLESTTSTSLTMPDENIKLYSHWNYQYSYNTVNVINGTIDGSSKGENLKQSSSHTIVAYSVQDGYEFSHWSLEGLGSFDNDHLSTTTFYIGDGNAIITANYKPTHTVTIENQNNNSEIITFKVKEGYTYNINSNEVLTDYMFDYWNKDGSKFSSSNDYYNITMGTSDVTYTAVYRNRNSYVLTVNNGSGSGTYKERQYVTINANSLEDGYKFSSWSGNWYSINDKYNSSTSIVMPSQNCIITANYKPTHTLTVNNGSGSGSYYEGQYFLCYRNEAPSGYKFSNWTNSNGDIISYSNPYTGYMGTSDITINANYELIPYFTLTVQNGSGSGTYIKYSSPTISMNPAPEGYKFLQWEVIEGDDNDVYQPLAETTCIRNLTHNVTVKAIYYIPETNTPYNLSITNETGTTTITQHYVGDQVEIDADDAKSGYKFHKWTGDTQYVNDIYSSKAIVNIPAKNISLSMSYILVGSEPKYEVSIEGGQLLAYTDDDGTEHWDIDYEFKEQSKVQIKANNPPVGWKFVQWQNSEGANEKSITTLNDITNPNTYLTVQDFKISIGRQIIERTKYSITVNNGETSGTYHESDSVSIYFNLEDTENTHYKFTRWGGNDLAYIKLIDGNSFDIYKSGTKDDPQIIRMPARNITITANYTTSYALFIDSVIKGYYKKGETIKVSATEIDGKTFMYWEGDTDYIDNKYNPNITVTMPSGSVNIIPKYHNSTDNNNIGYTLTDLSNNDTIDIKDITIISGTIQDGFIITDKNGNIYIVTGFTDTTCNVIKLTKTQGGTK